MKLDCLPLYSQIIKQKREKNLTIRGQSRINFMVLQNFTKKIENRIDITMQKNYRFSKNGFDYSRSAEELDGNGWQ